MFGQPAAKLPNTCRMDIPNGLIRKNVYVRHGYLAAGTNAGRLGIASAFNLPQICSLLGYLLGCVGHIEAFIR